MKLERELRTGLRQIDRYIHDCLASSDPQLTEMARYAVNSGGKRFRPAIMMLSYRALGGTDRAKIVPLAAAFELIHTATLVHDDINDHTSFRRGLPSIHQKYGQLHAIVTGDYLFVKAFELGGMYGEEIVRLTSEACTKLAEGELCQHMNLYNIGLSEKTYFEIIERKTAIPISAGAAAAAMLVTAEKRYISALRNYGYNIGMAFQIIDDVLDITGSERRLGKPVHTDIRQSNMTIVIIRALTQADERTRAKLVRILTKRKKTDAEIRAVVTQILRTDATEYARAIARNYAEKACAELSNIPVSKYTRMLRMMANFVVERTM